MHRSAALLAATAMIAVPAVAQEGDLVPAVVFDMGGKFDRSFNQGIYSGVELFSEESGIEYLEFEVTNEAQREQGLRRMARSGATAILAAGFAQASSVEVVAAEFPDVNFTIIDAVVDLPNVQSVIFREQEGSFLVGMLAAMASETGVVGFVGGMDIPLIRAFACGYAQGVHYVDPTLEVIENMTGTTPAAWNDPRAAASWRAASLTAGPMSSSPRPAVPASASIRRPKTPATWPSASTATRTTCTPAPC